MTDPVELVVVHTSPSRTAAELPLSVLRAEGIQCAARMTNRAAGIGDGMSSWGPHEVVVHKQDAEAARSLLSEDNFAS